ncbi:winged helix-turn-helix transcriptional regulator (plasmid) [Deinococcus sp. KNUC1210]|uniref:winged helix-turn-helix transcriptional regulator n=1 Tax=Deinococcus sp. KNUC1210 TaxID=2917691 RepID=UPI001EF10401|nr:winged helix-turn-helix transcriptional regulator [Deinococcus sp. KNUC1210]ULH13868.1 winged helix-turn-helix transcriptional regulator [Deinococcus sp. KNUC1210]
MAREREPQGRAFRIASVCTMLEQNLDARVVLDVICDGPVALKALCTLLPHLSTPRLSRSLQCLEEVGVIEQVSVCTQPVRMAYLLTGAAETCKPFLRGLSLPAPGAAATRSAARFQGRSSAAEPSASGLRTPHS